MGELTIVTGVPNSGKSEWLDALLVNLSKCHGWSFAFCSMEKRPKDHARQLIEKYCGKPFFKLAYAGDKVGRGPGAGAGVCAGQGVCVPPGVGACACAWHSRWCCAR